MRTGKRAVVYKGKVKPDISFVLGCGLIAFLTFLFTDIMFGYSEERQGVVLDKTYVPSRHEIGTVTVPDGKGGATTGTSSSSQSEEWKLLVEDSSGAMVSIRVAPSIYYRLHVGNMLKYHCRRGAITGRGYWNYI